MTKIVHSSCIGYKRHLNQTWNALTGHRIPAQGTALGFPWYTRLPRPERAPHIPDDLHLLKHAAPFQGA
jgi:hypothetical protein